MSSYLFLLLLSGSPQLKITTLGSFQEVFQAKAMSADESQQEFMLLDGEECRISILNRKTNEHRSFGSKGKGPGEFFIPISIACTAQHIFVGDFNKIHVFNRKSLIFEKVIAINSNPSSLIPEKGQFIAAYALFPSDGFGARILAEDGKVRHSFGTPNQNLIPEAFKDSENNHENLFLTRSKDHKLYTLNLMFYDVQIYSEAGQFIENFPVKKSPRYREPIPLKEKMTTREGARRWKAQFTSNASILIDDANQLWICFYDSPPGKLERNYHVDVYNAQKQKVLSYQPIPGPILAAGKKIYGAKESDDPENDYLELFQAELFTK